MSNPRVICVRIICARHGQSPQTSQRMYDVWESFTLVLHKPISGFANAICFSLNHNPCSHPSLCKTPRSHCNLACRCLILYPAATVCYPNKTGYWAGPCVSFPIIILYCNRTFRYTQTTGQYIQSMSAASFSVNNKWFHGPMGVYNMHASMTVEFLAYALYPV